MLAQRLLSSNIVGVKNDSAFDQYRLSHNYKCAEAVRTDRVIQAPPEHCRKFVVKYAKVEPEEPTHRRPTYLRTRIVTVSEVKIENETFVCVVCSCSCFRYEKHACRHLYRVFQRFPSVQDFMPECFKTYEVCYGSDTQYTQSVNRMRYWLEESGGLLYRQRLVDFCKLFTFSNSLDFYINTYLTSIDTNPRSTLPSGPKIPGDKGVLLPRHTRTRSGGSNSNYAIFHPLFA